jgi:hypothetical protein
MLRYDTDLSLKILKYYKLYFAKNMLLFYKSNIDTSHALQMRENGVSFSE